MISVKVTNQETFGFTHIVKAVSWDHFRARYLSYLVAVRCTAGPNHKNPPEIKRKKSVKLTDPNNACNTLTNSEYEGREYISSIF